MRLKNIRLENFRCYESLTLDLHPRLTVLVGKNGAGKTAILDALAIGLSPVLRYLSSANQRLSGIGLKDTDIRIESWGMRGGQQRWGACDFSQILVETTHSLKWDVWKGSTKGKSPTSKVGESDLARRMAKVSESLKSQHPEILPVFAYYGAQRGYIEIPQRLRAGNHHYDYPPSALLDALEAKSNFRGMLQWFDSEESAELRANKGSRPEEYQESIALRSVREAIKQVLGGDYSNPRFNREHKFVVDANEGPTPLYVSQLSQGYQSMLALSMDFARRLATGNGHLDQALSPFGDEKNSIVEALFDELRELNPQWFDDKANDSDVPSFEALPLLSPGVMLIDEVDLHLHPAWQQRVLKDLLRAFPMTQFIVTTHSPQVLSTIPAECIRILESEKDEQSDQQRIVVHPVTRQTQGVASSDLLAEVMDTDPTPDIKIARQLSHYKGMIQQDLESTDEALKLRTLLEKHYGERHPQMLECDRLMRLQAFKRRHSSRRNGEGN